MRALWDLAEREPEPERDAACLPLPAPGAAVEALPSGLFVSYEEPGPTSVPRRRRSVWPKPRRCSRTRAPSRRCERSSAARSCPGPRRTAGIRCTRPATGIPADVLTLFRQRQHHEQAYRVGVHDEFLDAVPCGYDKDSPDPQRPRFHRGPLQMMGWLVALVYNAVADLRGGVGRRLHGQPRADAAAEVFQPSGSRCRRRRRH